jgi:hypothetical protein
MLAGYPDILLHVLAELRGAFLDGADNREQMVELLAAQLTDPTSVQMAYQDVVDYAPQAEEAINLLLREHGELAEAQFSREYGAIRQMGPGCSTITASSAAASRAPARTRTPSSTCRRT